MVWSFVIKVCENGSVVFEKYIHNKCCSKMNCLSKRPVAPNRISLLRYVAYWRPCSSGGALCFRFRFNALSPKVIMTPSASTCLKSALRRAQGVSCESLYEPVRHLPEWPGGAAESHTREVRESAQRRCREQASLLVAVVPRSVVLNLKARAHACGRLHDGLIRRRSYQIGHPVADVCQQKKFPHDERRGSTRCCQRRMRAGSGAGVPR